MSQKRNYTHEIRKKNKEQKQKKTITVTCCEFAKTKEIKEKCLILF